VFYASWRPHSAHAVSDRRRDRGARGCASNYFEAAESHLDLARINDLSHKESDHCWFWGVCSHHGQIIEDHEEYVEAVRIRLGAGGPIDGGICSNCGERSLDRGGGHATCCAIGESTRGHNALRDTVFTFAKIADPSAELEPENLIPSRPRDRPADVLTAAVPGCVAALDIGVASPAAAAAGDDAAEAMWRRKVNEREDVRPELEQAGIQYRPFVFTAYGRPHPAASEAIKHIIKLAARRKGFAAKALERQFRSNISTVLARRLARMSLSTWPCEDS